MSASQSMTNAVLSHRAVHGRLREGRGFEHASVEPVVLVVMEHASEWPSQRNVASGGCVALRQETTESHGDLLRRTYERIRVIERRRAAVEVAALSCNDDASARALEERVPLARALLAAVLREGKGRFELVARASAPRRTRQSLVALAGTLTEALVGSSVSVCARFIEAPVPERIIHPRRRLVAV
jgi:hypothetical protein